MRRKCRRRKASPPCPGQLRNASPVKTVKSSWSQKFDESIEKVYACTTIHATHQATRHTSYATCRVTCPADLTLIRRDMTKRKILCVLVSVTQDLSTTRK